MKRIIPIVLVLSLAAAAPVRSTAETVDVDVPFQDFVSAVSGDDSAAVNRMLGEGYDYRAAAARNNGVTPLMIAAGGGRMRMLRLFLQRGDDVNALSSFNETAFTRAAWEEHFAEAETLLARGADPTLGAVGNGHPALDDCYNRMFADAARRPFLNLMVERTPRARARQGLSPALPTVLDHEDAEFARRLLEAGADVEYRLAKPYEGFTPLIFASARGQLDLVRLLLAHGADPNAADAGGITALMRALANMRWNAAEDIERRYQGVIGQLLAAKPDLARKATLELTHTPAATGTALDMAKLYLGQGTMTPVKKEIMRTIEDAYRSAGLLKPTPATKKTAKKTMKKKPAAKTVKR